MTIIYPLAGWPIKTTGGWRLKNFEPITDPKELTGYGSRLRIFAARQLFAEHPGSRVVASGGKGKLKDDPAAPVLSEVAAQELVAAGVPPSAVMKIQTPDFTFQELQEITRLFAEGKADEVLIVSNRYHLPRLTAFIECVGELMILRERLKRSQLRLISAEDLLLKKDPEAWSALIEEAYQSEQMKAIIQSEQQGVVQIRAGTYHYQRV